MTIAEFQQIKFGNPHGDPFLVEIVEMTTLDYIEFTHLNYLFECIRLSDAKRVLAFADELTIIIPNYSPKGA